MDEAQLWCFAGARGLTLLSTQGIGEVKTVAHAEAVHHTPMAVFWDNENCAVPKGAQGSKCV